MRIRWSNVVVLLLLVGIALLAANPESPVRIFLRSMAHVGRGYSETERILGVLAWLLVGVLLLVTLRRLVHHRDH